MNHADILENCMSENHLEIESKYYVKDLKAIEAKLLGLGAVCKVPRTFEYNLRFDDAEGNLKHTHRVLRLRKYNDVRLTYKGPGTEVEGALSRTEIELVLDDFGNAQLVLESLGYRVTIFYEKYRTLFRLDAAMITLDELPYGTFVEIESTGPKEISDMAQRLGLDQSAAIASSYQMLFDRVCLNRKLSAKNLGFKEFEGVSVSPEDLGVIPAD